MSPSFSDLGVARRAVSDLSTRGILAPFPIQAATLPDALAGRDVAGKAPTGSGKTLAFGLPLVERCGGASPGRPSGLVLVPTRELASQVADELVLLGRAHGRRVATVYGGVGFGPQRRALRNGVDILVACPGRLADLVNQGEVDLGHVRVVVVDEADRMADMGFLPEVRRLLDLTAADRQTLLFSATLDGDVDVLVRRYQRDPVRHELAGRDGERPEATHLFWKTTREDKVEHCAAVAAAAGPTIVFCRTRHGADRTARKLTNAGVESVAIHGARSQGQRDRALADFTGGRARALVATDVAARGIHVDDVAAVVHFDLPAEAKDYLHRSGRTARAGAAGVVVSLATNGERAAVAKIQRALELPVGLIDPDPTAIPAPPPATSNRSPTKHRGQATPRSRQAERPAQVTPGWAKPGAEKRSAGEANQALRRPPGGAASQMTPGWAKPGAEKRSAGAPNQHGRLKFFDARKGYGFIARAGRPDLFVHASAMTAIAESDLTDGLEVAYTVEPGRRGEQAASVRVAGPAPTGRRPAGRRQRPVPAGAR